MNFRNWTAIGLLTAFATVALSSPPDLTVPETVNGTPGAFITVAAKTTGASVAWIVLDAGLNLFPVQLLKDSKTAIVSSGTPGSYRVAALTASDKGEISAPVFCTVVVRGVTPPPPGPGPSPSPGPAPTPTAKAAWAVVILADNNRSSAPWLLATSASLKATLQKGGVALSALAIDDPAVAQNNYGPAVTAAGGAPALLVYDAKGNRLAAVKLPANEASFLAAIPGFKTSASRKNCPCGSNCNCPDGTCPQNCPQQRSQIVPGGFFYVPASDC